MATLDRLSVAERILLFLFEKSPDWADRMVLDDERLQALSAERERGQKSFSVHSAGSVNGDTGTNRTAT